VRPPALKARFEKRPQWHLGIAWADAPARLGADEALHALEPPAACLA
jgi:hypothetical protein